MKEKTKAGRRKRALEQTEEGEKAKEPETTATPTLAATSETLEDDSTGGDFEQLGHLSSRYEVRVETAFPKGYVPRERSSAELKELKERPPARIYPFVLDPFQQASIAALEEQESVLVSAHTSAGLFLLLFLIFMFILLFIVY